MRIRGWQGSVLFVLLVLVGTSIRTPSFVWTEPSPERSSLHVSSLPECMLPRADFDDDRVEDPLTFTASGGRPDVEIYLSRTQTVLVLPVEAVSSAAGSLTVRDLDSDGDEDLLWQGAQRLAPAEVIVWLNDGTGHFVRALPPGPVPFSPTPGPSLSTDSYHTRTPQVCALQQNPTPLGVLPSTRTRGTVTRARRDVSAARPAVSCSRQFPSVRAPPPHIA